MWTKSKMDKKRKRAVSSDLNLPMSHFSTGHFRIYHVYLVYHSLFPVRLPQKTYMGGSHLLGGKALRGFCTNNLHSSSSWKRCTLLFLNLQILTQIKRTRKWTSTCLNGRIIQDDGRHRATRTNRLKEGNAMTEMRKNEQGLWINFFCSSSIFYMFISCQWSQAVFFTLESSWFASQISKTTIE